MIFRLAIAVCFVFGWLSISGAQNLETSGRITFTKDGQRPITVEDLWRNGPLVIHWQQTYSRRDNGELYWARDPNLTFNIGYCCGVNAPDTVILTGGHFSQIEKRIGDETTSLRREMGELRELLNKNTAITRELHQAMIDRVAALPVELARNPEAYALLKTQLLKDLRDVFAEKSQSK